MTILITAATGTVGRTLASYLSAAGEPVRALVRDPERAREVLPEVVGLAAGDFADHDSIASAMRGVRQVFLAAPNHPDQVAWEVGVIDAARAAGVRRIVKLSAHGADPDSEVAFWAAHAAIEDRLAGSGLDWVSLRPTTYATTALGGFDGTVLAAPATGARISFIDPDDVASVATAVLFDPHWQGVLTLTGPAVLDFDEVASVLSDLVDREIPFVPVPDDAARAAFTAMGLPSWYADNVVRVFGALRAGVADLTTDTVQQITGRPARPLTEVLAGRLRVPVR